MSRNWEQIWKLAKDAGQMLIKDRGRGEKEFGRLLVLFPGDGMVFFERAKAFEAIGELVLAKADYEAAERLFPLERWKQKDRDAVKRIVELLAGGTITEAQRRVGSLTSVDASLQREVLAAMAKVGTEPSSAAADLRRCVEKLVDCLMDQHGIMVNDDLDRRIWALNDRGIVPDIGANHMHTIRILGNRALHPKSGEPDLQSGDIYPSVTAFVAILEWLNSQ